ncbi:MAG TPA: ABC transporter substrate-binding protein, partial [Anaerolineales bacterium]
MKIHLYPRRFPLGIVVFLAFVLTACGPGQTPAAATPETTPPPTYEALPSATSIASSLAPTPTNSPEPTPAPRTLTICLGAEPDTLFVYGGMMRVKSNIFEAIYDGPVDTNGYDYQPVILEKLPSLADGDARIEPVAVAAGDKVFNDAGEVVALAAGEKVRPYGCTRPGCAVAWDGGPLEMGQLSADFILLEGLRWSDGEPLTARDSNFSYSVARECGEKGDCGWFSLPLPMNYQTLERTASYGILNERTTRWTGLPGYLDLQYAVNFFFPLPEHQLRGVAPQEMVESEMTTRTPLGWGPYVLEGWVYGDRIRLSRNPYYFRAVEGLPRFDRLVFRF